MQSLAPRPRLIDFAEVALPTLAGAAYGWQRRLAAVDGGPRPEIGAMLSELALAVLAMLFAVLLLGSLVGRLRDLTSAALIGGAVPVLVGSMLVMPGGDALRDPVTWALAVPFAMWCGGVRLLEDPGPQTRTVYRVVNTLPLLTLAVPVIGGDLHWGIVILPFAVFRIAAKAADQLLPDGIDAAALVELRAMGRRTQWIGGLWVAAWAAVLP